MPVKKILTRFASGLMQDIKFKFSDVQDNVMYIYFKVTQSVTYTLPLTVYLFDEN